MKSRRVLQRFEVYELSPPPETLNEPNIRVQHQKFNVTRIYLDVYVSVYGRRVASDDKRATSETLSGRLIVYCFSSMYILFLSNIDYFSVCYACRGHVDRFYLFIFKFSRRAAKKKEK